MADVRIGMHLPRRGALATGDGVTAVARLSEELGFDSLWTGEHPALPWEHTSDYPYTDSGRMTWDPTTPWADSFVSLSWAGAVTNRIRLGTSILLLALRSPVLAAKSAATLDSFSGGRAMLGVGVGWLEGEFELVGQPFANRGPRTTEAIRVLKTCWGNEKIEFDGEYYKLAPFAANPKPAQGDRLPVLCGGSSDATLRRVAEVADGWLPSHLLPDEYAPKLEKLREFVELRGRSMSEIMLTSIPGKEHRVDREMLDGYAELGVELVIADADFDGTLDDALASIRQVAVEAGLRR